MVLKERIDDDRIAPKNLSFQTRQRSQALFEDRNRAFVKGVRIESYPGEHHLDIITDLIRSMT